MNEVDQGDVEFRLRAIQEQPLSDRAVAFAELHEELRARLDGIESQTPHGA